MLKKFRKNDIYINRVKAYPKVEFFVNSGSVESVYYNRVNENRTSRKDGHAHLNDIVGGFFEGQIFNFSYDAQQGVVGTSASIAPNNSFGWTDFAFESTPPPGLGIVPSTGLITGTFSPESLMTGSGASTGIDTITISALGPETAFTASFQLTVVGTDLPLPDMYASFDDNFFPPVLNGGMRTLGAVPQELFLTGAAIASVTGNVGEARDFETANKVLQTNSVDPSLKSLGDLSLAWTQGFSRTAGHDQTVFGIAGVGESAATNVLFLARVETGERIETIHESGGGTDRIAIANSVVDQTNTYQSFVVTRNTASLEMNFYYDGLLDATDSYAANPTGGASSNNLAIGESAAGAGNNYENILDELAYWSTVRLDENQAATIGWLMAKQDSLADWIRGDPPNAPAYSDQGPFDEGVAITPFTPDTPSVDPEAETVTYYEYDELPAGLSLNSSNGEISGTPTTAGTYNIRVAASDGMHLVVSNTFEIEVVV
jgi:hypothetical protein